MKKEKKKCENNDEFFMDTMTGKMHKEGQKDATAKYEACGNVFFSFLE